MTQGVVTLEVKCAVCGVAVLVVAMGLPGGTEPVVPVPAAPADVVRSVEAPSSAGDPVVLARVDVPFWVVLVGARGAVLEAASCGCLSTDGSACALAHPSLETQGSVNGGTV